MKIYKIAQDKPKNPSDMTEQEFMDYHRTGFIPESAYEKYKTVDGLSWITKAKNPVLHSVKEFGGKTIEFRMSGEKLQYAKWRDDGDDLVRDEKGLAVYMSEEEMKMRNLPLVDTSITAFDGDTAIGWASNEFGADGVWVVDAYQRMGIGTYLLTEFRKQFPEKRKIGQMTNAGYNMTRAYYRKLQEQKANG